MPTSDSRIEALARVHELTMELTRKRCKKSFSEFVRYIDDDHTFEWLWFHRLIAEKLQDVAEGRIKRLMLFVPPQHGKSELSSRLFPSWYLGVKPDKKVVVSSYSADLAGSFTRDARRIMVDDKYRGIFNETGNIPTVKSAKYFETVSGGFYKAVGVRGGLTGRKSDLAIIDDPFKDARDANSKVNREAVWNWYTHVLETRLHNNSAVILIMTRWHDDDLAGRLLKREPGEWDVVSIPAIREDVDETGVDPREPGEALFPSMHSIEKLRRFETLAPKAFRALYQQKPTKDGGNIVKSEWFRYIEYNEFKRLRTLEPINFYLDTAFTKQKENDPTGAIGTCIVGNTLYILDAKKLYMKFPDLIRFIPSYVKNLGYTSSSLIKIEPKANGKSVVDQLIDQTRLNVMETSSPDDDKETRLNAYSPFIQVGRVCLVIDSWNEDFVTEICDFPLAPHDEYVDLICYALEDFHFEDGDQDLSKIFG